MTAPTQLAFELSLIGPWRNFDPHGPLPSRGFEEVQQQLMAAGLLPVPDYDGARFMLGAVLMEFATADIAGDDAPDEPPITASLLVHEHEGEVDVRLTDDGTSIEPVRRVSRFSTQWPTADVGSIEFHRVSYLVPHPDGGSYLTLVFVTPNLTIVDDMEALFDTIVSTAAWVEPEPASAGQAGS